MSKTRQRSSVKTDGTSFTLFAQCLYGSRRKGTKGNEIKLDKFHQRNLIPLSSRKFGSVFAEKIRYDCKEPWAAKCRAFRHFGRRNFFG